MLLCWYQIHVLYISWIVLTSTVYYVVLIFKFQYMYFYQSMWFLNFIKNYIYQRMINDGFWGFFHWTTFENYCVIMIQWIQSRLYVNFSFFLQLCWGNTTKWYSAILSSTWRGMMQCCSTNSYRYCLQNVLYLVTVYTKL